MQPAIGDFMWTAYSADYRRYDSIIFNKLIVALHLQGYYVRGRDSDSLRRYIAYSDVVRGYDGSNRGRQQQRGLPEPADDRDRLLQSDDRQQRASGGRSSSARPSIAAGAA